MAQNSETRVQNSAFLAVGQRPDVIVWRQQVGKYRAMHDPERVVTVGVPGMADSMMVVAVEITPEMVGRKIGVAVAVEFKTEKGQQEKRQKAWQNAFESRGGIYALVRSADEMVKLVEDVQNGRY